jgi:glycogen phosphorylase
MTNLAVVGTHSTNGVSAIHSDLVRKQLMPDFAEMFPESFNNESNGVTPRRWLLLTNPALTSLITESIGTGWVSGPHAVARGCSPR